MASTPTSSDAKGVTDGSVEDLKALIKRTRSMRAAQRGSEKKKVDHQVAAFYADIADKPAYTKDWPARVEPRTRVSHIPAPSSSTRGGSLKVPAKTAGDIPFTVTSSKQSGGLHKQHSMKELSTNRYDRSPSPTIDPEHIPTPVYIAAWESDLRFSGNEFTAPRMRHGGKGIPPLKDIPRMLKPQSGSRKSKSPSSARSSPRSGKSSPDRAATRSVTPLFDRDSLMSSKSSKQKVSKGKEEVSLESDPEDPFIGDGDDSDLNDTFTLRNHIIGGKGASEKSSNDKPSSNKSSKKKNAVKKSPLKTGPGRRPSVTEFENLEKLAEFEQLEEIVSSPDSSPFPAKVTLVSSPSKKEKTLRLRLEVDPNDSKALFELSQLLGTNTETEQESANLYRRAVAANLDDEDRRRNVVTPPGQREALLQTMFDPDGPKKQRNSVDIVVVGNRATVINSDTASSKNGSLSRRFSSPPLSPTSRPQRPGEIRLLNGRGPSRRRKVTLL